MKRPRFRWLFLALQGLTLLHAVPGCSQHYDEAAELNRNISGSFVDPSPSVMSSTGDTLPAMPPIALPSDTSMPPVGIVGSLPQFEVTLAPEDMVRQFANEQDSVPCDDPLFGSDLTFERSAETPILHVNADGAALGPGEKTSSAPDGSWGAPFATIGAALSVAAPGTTVLVALGTYDEGIRIPAGVLVKGGLDPSTWDPTASKSIVTNGVYFQADPAASVGIEREDILGAFAGLVDFDVRRGVYAESGSRVVVRNNLVSVDAETLPRNGTYRAGVEAVDAFLRAEDNIVTYSVDPIPDHAFDSGFIQTGGCSLITRNRVIAFKTSFRVEDAVATTIVHNVAEGSYNGVWLENSDTTVAANAFYFVPPARGCVYAMYLRLDSNPKVRNNHFFLGWINNRGIDEECLGCDPEELWGNVFHTHSPDSILYLDRTSPELESTSLNWMTDVESINGMSDIAVIGDNVSDVTDPANP